MSLVVYLGPSGPTMYTAKTTALWLFGLHAGNGVKSAVADVLKQCKTR